MQVCEAGGVRTGCGCCGGRGELPRSKVGREIYLRKAPVMPATEHRVVFCAALRTARIFGWILIALAILGLPQMRILIGRLAVSFGLLSSIALGLAGVAWLVAVKLFLRFFDRYLSRN